MGNLLAHFKRYLCSCVAEIPSVLNEFLASFTASQFQDTKSQERTLFPTHSVGFRKLRFQSSFLSVAQHGRYVRIDMKQILFLITLIFVLNLNASTIEEVEKSYFKNLDSWVANGGNKNEIQDIVITNCGKLVMITANSVEKLKLSTTQRSEFDYRLDVCAKMTVNRVYPQPEFKNQKIVQSICEDNVLLFKKLCKKNGFD